MDELEVVEEPENRLCGVITTSSSGREWICIAPVHAKVYRRKTGLNRRGQPIFSNNPKADQHLFVNRWPNRELDFGQNEVLEGY